MYDPFVALIVSNVPSAFSTSNRISPSRTANHAAESGYMRRSYFVPARILHEKRHRIAVVDDRLAPARLPFVFGLDVCKARDGLHRRFVFADEGLRIEQHARFLLGGDAGRHQEYQQQHDSHSTSHDPHDPVTTDPPTAICPATSQRRRTTDSARPASARRRARACLCSDRCERS